MLDLRKGPGDRLAITRSLDPTPEKVGWAAPAGFNQMQQDLTDLLWIGDHGNHIHG